MAMILESEAIDPAQIQMTLPLIFATQEECTVWFCVDFKGREAVTVWSLYPMPPTEECVDLLGVASVLNTLDTNSSFTQVKVAKGNRE